MPVVVLMLSPAPVANRTAPPRAGNICHRGFHDITLLVTVTAVSGLQRQTAVLSQQK